MQEIAVGQTQTMLNGGYAYRSIVGATGTGFLVAYLAGLYAHSTEAEWQGNLDRGEVAVDGVIASGRELVRPGQAIVWTRPPWVEPEVPRHFKVLFEDDDLLAVNKPGGLPTLPGGGFLENTLLRLVQKRNPEANPVHRLGRGTSGIVLFAKNAQVAAKLSAGWNTAAVEKVYRALAQGVAVENVYEIVTPIGLVAHPLIGSVWAASALGKASKSVAKVVGRTGDTTTFAVSLYSGRPHQIRIHLASIGHPLVGDRLYGTGGLPLGELAALPGDGGYLLHAGRLEFSHPVLGEAMKLEADLPDGWGG